jgi:hypothetical protein
LKELWREYNKHGGALTPIFESALRCVAEREAVNKERLYHSITMAQKTANNGRSNGTLSWEGIIGMGQLRVTSV